MQYLKNELKECKNFKNFHIKDAREVLPESEIFLIARKTNTPLQDLVIILDTTCSIKMEDGGWIWMLFASSILILILLLFLQLLKETVYMMACRYGKSLSEQMRRCRYIGAAAADCCRIFAGNGFTVQRAGLRCRMVRKDFAGKKNDGTKRDG